MYAPYDRLGAAHQRFEVNVGAPTSNLNAPARKYSSKALVQLPKNRLFAPHHEAYGFAGDINHARFSQDALHAYHQFSAGRRPPTPPLHDYGTYNLSLHSSHLNPSYVPQELPRSLEDLLPRTREYLSGSKIDKKDHFITWNTGCTGSNQDKWAVHDHPPQTDQNLPPAAWDHSPVHAGQSKLEHAVGYRSPHVALLTTQYVPAPEHYHPRRASSILSSPTLTDHYGQPSQMPVLQQWRTDNLAARAPTRVAKMTVDAATRRKQELYRQKGEARRHTIATGMLELRALAHEPLPTPEPSSANAIAPRKRRKVIPASSAKETGGVQSNRSRSASTTHHDVYGSSASGALSLHPYTPEYDRELVEQPGPNPDELPQPIVDEYEDYKWSVCLYELQPSRGYDFAQRWLEQLFETGLQSEYQRHRFSHVSKGFIKDGGRYSLLVLHNATNPFEYEPAPDSTVTMGVYGYHWYRHDEIHWTTLGSDQRQLLAQCVEMDHLMLRHKWGTDTDKAAEKRFHRAYWLAANRRDLKGLLNRSPSEDKAHDVVEDKSADDADGEFRIEESDLTNAWDVSVDESAAAWVSVQEEAEGVEDEWVVHGSGWQHVVIGSSEW